MRPLVTARFQNSLSVPSDMENVSGTCLLTDDLSVVQNMEQQGLSPKDQMRSLKSRVLFPDDSGSQNLVVFLLLFRIYQQKKSLRQP